MPDTTTHPAKPWGGPSAIGGRSQDEESTAIGNDPVSGSTTDHDIGAPPGAPASEAAAPPGAHEVKAGPLPQGVYWQKDRGPGPDVVSADVFDGETVENAAGETLGRVDRLMIDLANGRIAYAVVELPASSGGRLCAIPWRAMEVEGRQARLRVVLSPDDLREAPTFTRGEWPSMGDEEWVQEVHTFFACRPYWI